MTVYLIFLLITFQSYSVFSKDCFSRLTGTVGDIDANIEDIQLLNNKIQPLLKNILRKDYFYFYQVNLDRRCSFFPDDSRCSIRECHVDNCPVEDIPVGLRDKSYLKSVNEGETDDGIDCGLGQLDGSLSDERKTIIANWSLYDAEDESLFCEPEDESTGMVYVDLLKNPERYTGYKGFAANRIWHMIYKENCFNNDGVNPESGYAQFLNPLCLEKRAFYRLISGLHSSISIHLAYIHPPNSFKQLDPNNDQWGPNVEEFRRRFDPVSVPDGINRLRNLYFTYLVELRAFAKAAPFLLKQTYFTGNAKMDEETKLAVTNLLNIIQKDGNIFHEDLLFTDNSSETHILKRQFREHFRNISRIMDCVGCEKCRLWGKLQIPFRRITVCLKSDCGLRQKPTNVKIVINNFCDQSGVIVVVTHGMGTALKILFSSPNKSQRQQQRGETEQDIQLNRREIVSMFNAFGRLSNSVNIVNEFCELMNER